jgi:uncharacterized membrane protein YeaQ/YmgE (transglycosylase-associated protein family)
MHMSGESLLVIVVVGVVAGWLAGQIVRGTGFGLVGDLLIGIAGAFMAVGCCLNSMCTSARVSPRRSRTRLLAP